MANAPPTQNWREGNVGNVCVLKQDVDFSQSIGLVAKGTRGVIAKASPAGSKRSAYSVTFGSPAQTKNFLDDMIIIGNKYAHGNYKVEMLIGGERTPRVDVPTSEGNQDFEPRTWSYQGQDDRHVFRLASSVLPESYAQDRMLFDLGKRNTTGRFRINGANDEQGSNEWPKAGDTVWRSFEIMRHKSHDAPYWRFPVYFGWSNRDELVKIAFKIVWQKPGRDGQPGEAFVKYLQRDPAAIFTTHEDEKTYSPGSLTQYAEACGLHAYFMRRRYPTTPETEFLSDMGFAKIAISNFQYLKQAVQLTILQGSLEPKPFTAPVFSYEAISEAMENLGLEHVNDKSAPKLGVHRTTCDRCYLIKTGASGGAGAAMDLCVKLEGMDINQCTTCFLWGLPCSWTPTADLRGLTSKFQEYFMPIPRNILATTAQKEPGPPGYTLLQVKADDVGDDKGGKD